LLRSALRTGTNIIILTEKRKKQDIFSFSIGWKNKQGVKKIGGAKKSLHLCFSFSCKMLIFRLYFVVQGAAIYKYSCTLHQQIILSQNGLIDYLS
jgi:hypothetical protein